MNGQKRTEIPTSEKTPDARRVKNTVQRDWRPRLEDAWSVRPDLNASLQNLYRRAATAGGDAIRSFEDFRHKLSGKRPASPAFLRVVFDAAKLDAMGVTFDDWMGSDDIWRDCLDKIQPQTAKKIIDDIGNTANINPKIVGMRTPGQATRRFSPKAPENVLCIGERVNLVVSYVGETPLYAAHFFCIEYCERDGAWQCLNALKTCALNDGRAFDFQLSKKGDRVAAIDLGLFAYPPPSNYILYVFANQRPFDHRLSVLIDRLDPETGDVTPQMLSKIARLLNENITTLFAGITKYIIY